MAFSPSKRNLHFSLTVLSISIFLISTASAAVYTAYGWHNVSQIAISSASTTSIDDNRNGVVDIAENSSSCRGDSICEATSLGVGTVAPARLVELFQTDNNNAILRLSSWNSNPINTYESGLELATTRPSTQSLVQTGSIYARYDGVAFSDGRMTLKSVNAAGALTDTLTLKNTNIGIGTTDPSQKLTLGSGNILLPNTAGDATGNLFIGGITNNGQPGLRLMGGLVNGVTPASFIDVMTTDPADGLRIRVDTAAGGTERMRITASGNIGIGTSSPSQMLTVSGGNIHLDDNRYIMGNGHNLLTSFSGDTWLGLDGATYIRSGGNPAARVTIDTSGNVGIGKVPTQNLDVLGNIVASNLIGGQNGVCIGADCRSAWPASGATGSGSPSYMPKWTAATTLGNSIVYDTGTNVGIGTVVPPNKLTVQSTTQYDGIALRNAGNYVAKLSGFSAANDRGSLQLFNSGADSIRLDSAGASWINGGNLGIGTSSPLAKLYIQSSIAGESLLTLKNTGTDSNSGLRLQNDARNWLIQVNGWDSDKLAIWDETAGAGRLVIDSSGNVGIGTTTPSAKLDVTNGYIRALEGSNTPPASGSGVEMVYTGGRGYLISYNRSSSQYRPLEIWASEICFNGACGGSGLTVGSTLPASYSGCSGNVLFPLDTTTSGGRIVIKYGTSFACGAYLPCPVPDAVNYYIDYYGNGQWGTCTSVLQVCPCDPGGGGESCFVSSTKVAMADGSLRNIEDIQIGDKVTGAQGVSTVKGLVKHKLAGRSTFLLNGKVELTGDHPILTTEGWKVVDLKSFYRTQRNAFQKSEKELEFQPGELELGDTLVTQSGTEPLVSIEEKHERPASETVYDLRLDRDQTYIANGFVAHTEYI